MEAILNNRLSFSLAFSLLTHLFIFIAAGLLIQLHAPIPKEAKVNILEVRLAQPAPAKTQPEASKTLLTSKLPAQFKIAQPNIKNPPDHIPKPIPPVVEEPSAPSGEIEGVMFPGTVATPFQGARRSSSSLFHPPPSQQNAAQNYYQQAREAQARQRTEYQARLILQQLQQLLAKELDVSPAVSGTCKLSEPDGNANTRLACDSSALYEVISKSEMDVVGMLIALRGMGNMFNGFSAEYRSEKLSITLINENAQTDQNPSTLPANKSQ